MGQTRQRTRQPNQAAAVAYGTPLARDLVFLSTPFLGYDAVSGKRMIYISSPTLGASSGGMSVSSNGTSSYLQLSIPSFATSEYTIFALVQGNTASPGTAKRILTLGNTSNANTIAQISTGNTTQTKGMVWCRDDANVSPSIVDTTAVLLDQTRPHIMHVVVDVISGISQTIRGYVDGKLDASSAVNGSTSTLNIVTVGALRFGGTTNSWCSCHIFLAGFAKRAWSADEVAQHAAAPYSLFARRRRFRGEDVAAGGFVAIQRRTLGQRVGSRAG